MVATFYLYFHICFINLTVGGMPFTQFVRVKFDAVILYPVYHPFHTFLCRSGESELYRSCTESRNK